MTPILYIVVGLFFIASGSFVLFQGVRARKVSQAPLPTFFVIALAIHGVIALGGIGLVAWGLAAMIGS